MKKFKLYSLVAATMAMGLTSCGEDFLTEEPSSSLPLDGYYKTEARMQESMVAAYDPMQWFDYFGGWAPLSFIWDCMSDDVYVGGSNTTDQSQIHLISQYKSDPNNSIGGLWSAAYSGINRSIHLIDNAAACEALSEADKNIYQAEGRVLRDWYYSVLWKTWGNIPFYLENLTFPYIAEQKSAADVYEAVVTDLEGVIDSNVLPMKQPDEWAGRVTQAVASMIYADMVMIQNDNSRYNKALGYMKAIISSGQYGLVSDYDELFALTTEWNKEIIWDINFISKGGERGWGDANSTGGTVLPAMIGVDGLNYNGTGVNTGFGPYTEFVGGWGFEPVAKEAYDAFEEGDLRRDVAILNMAKYIEDMAGQGIKVTYGGRYQNTGYFLRKYLGRPGGKEGAVDSGDLNWDTNLHLYRYAETLLNAAELALATGDTGSAQKYFDQVRERAGLASKTVSADALLHERHVELVGEGKRYFDLVRTGKASSVLKAGGGVVLQDKENLVWGGTAIPERSAWTENKKYLPIPQGEIEAAQGTLTQNNY
ncbi:MAG: RagB/SusD family nutrient uptake outer membrane protein [Bacteroides sp.]|nr:RagB/SusD family nutrient uptake outer membrane protein [Bacteroides sp.]